MRVMGVLGLQTHFGIFGPWRRQLECRDPHGSYAWDYDVYWLRDKSSWSIFGHNLNWLAQWLLLVSFSEDLSKRKRTVKDEIKPFPS